MALQQLNTALQSLSESVLNFNVGAVSITDFKPFEERLVDMRQILRVQKSHSSLIYAKHNSYLSETVAENPQEDISSLVSAMHEEIANLQIANMTITLCLQSCSNDDIMYKDKPTPDFKIQVKSYMRKLFMMNDNLISLHTSMIQALKNELTLKIAGVKLLREHKVFLREQGKIRDKKLEESNPEVLRNKQKLETKIAKINLMKRLMTNMIATSADIIVENPFLFEMLKKHRELINIETVIEMGRNTPAPDNS